MNTYIECWCFCRFSSYIITLILAGIVFFSGCSENDVAMGSSPELVLRLNSTSSSYSTAGESLEFSYEVTNIGNVSLDGPVVISSNLMTAYCPELIKVENKDEQLQPGEAITCDSAYSVAPSDLDAKNIVNTAIAVAGGTASNQVSMTLANNMPESLLIFPFDTTDPSVVFRSSLTSADEILSAGGIEETGSLNEFDEILGMKPASSIDGIPGCRFTSSSIIGLSSIPSGQLSIEVEREWLAITDANIGSIGYNRSSIEYLLSFGVSDGSNFGRIMMQTDGYLNYRFSPFDAMRSAKYVNTSKSERFARVTISWTPSESRLYIDGLLLARINRNDGNSDYLANVFIGSLGGNYENSMRNNYYVRNLIVSSRPIATNNKPLLRHVMHIGDSFAAGQPLHNVVPKYDGTIVNTVIRELFTNGFSYDKYTVYSNGGGKIQDLTNDPLELDVTNGGGVSRAVALNGDPSLVVFITGGNDLGIFQNDLFTADLHDHVEAFFGVNGYASTNVQHVIVTTTTINSSSAPDNLIAMRDIMLGLSDWWNATYPDMAGRVHVVDTWELFGGASADQSLFGASDPVHPNAAGNIVYGNAIAEQIMSLMH